MKEKKRDHFRERLMEERDGLVRALTSFDERFRERLETGDDDLSHYPLHMADEGTDTMEQEKEFLLASQEGRRLVAVDEALRRIYKEPETYGTCERCGERIADDRLDVVPWARHCIDCKRELESAGEETTA